MAQHALDAIALRVERPILRDPHPSVRPTGHASPYLPSGKVGSDRGDISSFGNHVGKRLAVKHGHKCAKRILQHARQAAGRGAAIDEIEAVRGVTAPFRRWAPINHASLCDALPAFVPTARSWRGPKCKALRPLRNCKIGGDQ
ncbi:hypothetical protein [Sphingobium sp. C100]|uniref:hypothetical protein n=1 Tax=Sphingobium sp. C100 TaxID=1207055 RepID=UPI001377DE93|nr:hypothetical protein [Sphingobium sp. C100]